MYNTYLITYTNFVKFIFCKGFFENGPSIHRINDLFPLKPPLAHSHVNVLVGLLLAELARMVAMAT